MLRLVVLTATLRRNQPSSSCRTRQQYVSYCSSSFCPSQPALFCGHRNVHLGSTSMGWMIHARFPVSVGSFQVALGALRVNLVGQMSSFSHVNLLLLVNCSDIPDRDPEGKASFQ